MIFNDGKVSPAQLSVLLKLIMSSEIESGVGGMFQYCTGGSNEVYSLPPTITQEEREMLTKCYRETLYTRAGYDLPEITEDASVTEDVPKKKSRKKKKETKDG